jgi:hypothetical protein
MARSRRQNGTVQTLWHIVAEWLAEYTMNCGSFKRAEPACMHLGVVSSFAFGFHLPSNLDAHQRSIEIMTVTRQVSPTASATTISSTMNSTTQEGDPAGTYSFTIVNQSGVSQSYAIFCKEPAVNPPAHGLVSHAVLVAHGVASGSGTAFLTLPRTELYALCGINCKDATVQVRVLDRRPVSLGTGSSHTLRHGTTCVTQVTSATPSFALWGGPADDRGEVGAFCIETGADFTYEQAAASEFKHLSPNLTQRMTRLIDYRKLYPRPRPQLLRTRTCGSLCFLHSSSADNISDQAQQNVLRCA